METTLLAQCLRRKCTTRATSPIWWDALVMRHLFFQEQEHLLLAWRRISGLRIDAENFNICKEGKIGAKKLLKCLVWRWSRLMMTP